MIILHIYLKMQCTINQKKVVNPTEKENWRINLENAVAEAIVKVGYEVVKSIFRRYEAKNLETLRTCYYAEVFADLQQIIYD